MSNQLSLCSDTFNSTLSYIECTQSHTDTDIVLAQVMNSNSHKGRASGLEVSYIVVMSDHFSKCLNTLAFDQTLCQENCEL